MRLWIEEHQAHFGRSKFTSGEAPGERCRPSAKLDQELTATDYDFTSTEKLIGNLSALAGRAMRDLEAARLTGGPAVARASKVFNDAVHQLRQALVSRDQLQASAGDATDFKILCPSQSDSERLASHNRQHANRPRRYNFRYHA
jgi:hypothetical protein